ncbi:hypothetical protein [Oceanisphaera arctica]|uniref:Uncharacterized protein n=1 Tax=Oceanisphaera arctica TaxID=641510 RepID=A0A2P5TK54_9GAMM|nr:hypothetical protein [Oceanisphaera arctica]PPL15470.1 hypothetical protein UN63_12390 [Oceanisphaera arctica]GHA05420.1 hypothetical protein GCM10007082_02910 [Oceanisphaera arctica]
MSDILHPRDHLRLHWRQAKADFWRQWQPCFEQGEDHTRLMITLGTIRSLYWQSLGQGMLAIARTIGNWWRKTAPLHCLGEVVL